MRRSLSPPLTGCVSFVGNNQEKQMAKGKNQRKETEKPKKEKK